MNYYQFFPDDQARNNWLLSTELKEPPWVLLKPRYRDCECSKCGSINRDKAFSEGFDELTKVRAKGDFFFSSDGFLCVSENVKKVIESVGFHDGALKPVSKAGWWVVNVTLRVNSDQRAYTVRNRCDQCGRARQCYGRICSLEQIDVPNQAIFFSSVVDRGGFVGRDVFVTEDTVALFKKQGLKGGSFSRLLTPSEFEAVKVAGVEMDPLRWPKDSQLSL